VEDCRCVQEATSYLEILNYSVSFAFLPHSVWISKLEGRRQACTRPLAIAGKDLGVLYNCRTVRRRREELSDGVLKARQLTGPSCVGSLTQ
jgi:hypothetical protein